MRGRNLQSRSPKAVAVAGFGSAEVPKSARRGAALGALGRAYQLTGSALPSS